MVFTAVKGVLEVNVRQAYMMSKYPSGQRCVECGKKDMAPDTIAHVAHMKHDGTSYEIAIPQLHVLKCKSCGDVVFDDESDEQMSQALRDHLGLLSPEEIHARLNQLGLTQKAFSELLCIAAETVSRWMNGAYIQCRAYDKLMRLVLEQEEARLPVPSGCGSVSSAVHMPE
jgi:putative zinc finger/helix-turn-helix YgiT family protein